MVENYIDKVNCNVKIDEGKIFLESFLREVYLNESTSNKNIAEVIKLPIPIVSAIKKEFIKEKILIQENGIKLTSLGKKYVEEELKYSQLNKNIYKELINEDYLNSKSFNELSAELNEIMDNRPKADLTIDQTHCTATTSLKRAIFCLKNNSLIGKNIICIGDDDLVSISLGLLLKKLFKSSEDKAFIKVIDIDSRYLEYISEVSNRLNLNITCENLDLRIPIQNELLNKFDCFFTDPPYTLNGLKLFLTRGIETLKKEKGLSIFLSFSHKSPDFTFKMMQLFIDLNIVPIEIIKGFNRYIGAGIIGNEGQLIYLNTTSNTENIEEDIFLDKIYTGEMREGKKIYICKGCGEKYEIGFGKEIKTIEELKKIKCRKCNSDTFDIQNKIKKSL